MARGFDLSERDKHAIAKQLSGFPLQASTRTPAERHLSAHLAVWMLKFNSEMALAHRMSVIAQNTRFVHHQIRMGNTHPHYARSKREKAGDKGWHVHGFFTSELGDKLAPVLHKIDTEMSDDASEVAHLLVIPLRHIHAVWLEGETTDKIIFISKPSRRGPALGHVYLLRAFLNVLSKGADFGS